jgi:hypothetical protein
VVLGDLLGDLSSSWGSSWVSVLLSLDYLHSHERMRTAEVRSVRDSSHEWDWSARLSVRTVVSSNSHSILWHPLVQTVDEAEVVPGAMLMESLGRGRFRTML